MTPRPLLVPTLWLLGMAASAGCGDPDPASDPAPAGAGGLDSDCPSASGPVDPTALIDDMEDGDGGLPRVANRNGSWWVAGDDSPGAESIPPVDGSIFAERIPEGRCGSNFAMRVSGSGFDEWGANLAFAFSYGGSGIDPVDFSRRRGIMLWARVGDTHDAEVRAELQDRNSIPAGGVCDEAGGPETFCWNGYGTALEPLDTQWRQYVLYFDRLAQENYGLLTPALALDSLYTMEFSLSPGSVFDLWIDDLMLLD